MSAYGAMKHALREGLPPVPDRMKGQPIDERGYPVPWFVVWIDGKPDFRIADTYKRNLAAKFRKCWICGGALGKYLTFVIGPMCAVTRSTAEPACHYECALFAVQACPFMLLPKAQYRRAGVEHTVQPVAEHALPGNPGATCFWVCHDFKIEIVGKDPSDWLFRLKDPQRVEWYREGRLATRAEIMESMDARLPLLQAEAARKGAQAIEDLTEAVKKAWRYLPAHVPLGAS